MPRSPAATACRLLHWPSKKASAHPISRGLSASAISPRTSRELFSTGASRAGWPQTSCWYSRVCRSLGTISGPCSALLEPIPALSFIDIAESRAAQPALGAAAPTGANRIGDAAVLKYRPIETLPLLSAMLLDLSRLCRPYCPASSPHRRKTLGFSRNEGEIWRETDCLLE